VAPHYGGVGMLTLGQAATQQAAPLATIHAADAAAVHVNTRDGGSDKVGSLRSRSSQPV